jgi:hypothetical protein
MQILEVPYNSDDVVAGVSLKGVTFLKNSRYRSRHKGAPDYVQHPHLGYLSKADSRKLFPPKPQKTARKHTPPKPVVLRKPAAYKIDKKTVTHRIIGFVNAMQGKKRLHLWTITFYQGTPDDTCHHLFRKWLIRMSTDEKLRDYLWITERQKNGTLHFHIAVNQYLDIKRCNRYMRAAMMRSVEDGTAILDPEAIKKYNGVDIQKHKTTRRVTNFAKKKAAKSLSNYLAKYVSKNDTTFPRLAWHNSRSYTNVITHVHLTMKQFSQTDLQDRLQTEKPLEGEWFTFYRWKGPPPDTVANYLAFVTNHINNLN